MGNRKGIRIGVFLLAGMFFTFWIDGRVEGAGLEQETQRVQMDAEDGEGKAHNGGMESGKEKKEAGREEIILENESILEEVYKKLGKQPGSPLYKDELEEMEGKLDLQGIIRVSNGSDMDFLKNYCAINNVLEWEVVFSPDLEGWTEEQLEGLRDFRQRVKVKSLDGTVSAAALPYFTGTSEIIFEIDDVTGKMGEGRVFPEQIQSVSLYGFSEEKYKNLLNCMWESEVETLSVHYGGLEGGDRIFWMDQVAGMESMKYLDVNDNILRVRDAQSLKKMELCGLCGTVDKETGVVFLEKLSELEKVTLAVTEEMDLEPLLEREGLALRLTFCQKMVEFEEDIFDGKGAVVCDGLDEALGWRKEKSVESKKEDFLAIYQKFIDDGRKIECFSVRGREGEEMYNVKTFLRVTDKGQAYILDPEDEDWGFGSYRQDYVSLKDINFDGVKDITLDMGHFGNQGSTYETGWIWEEEQGKYILCNSYYQIVNPQVDSEHKLVRSSWRNWAASHSWAIYRYEKGEFVKKSELTEEPLQEDEIPEDMVVPEGAEVWRWVEEIYENGKVAETKSFVIACVEGEENEYPEGCERFFEEDSYWGRQS